MDRRTAENFIKTGLVALAGSAITYAAIKRMPEAILEMTKSALGVNVDNNNVNLEDVFVKIPGRWKIADLIAQSLSEPRFDWTEQKIASFKAHPFSRRVRGDVLGYATRPSQIHPELVIVLLQSPPDERSKWFFGTARNTNETYYIAHRSIDPLSNPAKNLGLSS